MVTAENIDLKDITIEELVGVVNLYPWFGCARKEMCIRIARMGGSNADFATNALYIGSRRIVSDIVRSVRTDDYSDKNLKDVLDRLTSNRKEAQPKEVKPKVRVVGGDYFSQDEYDSVKGANDSIYPSFVTNVVGEKSKDVFEGDIPDAFCTETLAQIYLEQYHFEQAKYIYSKLILRYPEKSAYFASLIEKLAQLTDN